MIVEALFLCSTLEKVEAERSELLKMLAANDVELQVVAGERKIFVDKSIVITALSAMQFEANEGTVIGKIDIEEIETLIEALTFSEGLTVPRQKAIWILKALRALMVASAEKSNQTSLQE